MTKLGGRMNEAQDKRGGVSADQAAWGEDKLMRSCCHIYLTSSCLINPVGGEWSPGGCEGGGCGNQSMK